MKERPRRRRSDEDSGGGGLPLFPLVLVVILAGLLLGGALAHFFGGSKSSPATLPTAIAALPTPLPTPAPVVTRPTIPTAMPSGSAKPLPTPSAASPTPSAASPTPSAASPSPSPSPAPSRTPKPRATPSLAPTPSQTTTPPKAAAAPTPKPVLTPTSAAALPPENATDRAAGVVRSYLQALSRGDRATASTYLERGLPNESFMSNDAHIQSIHSMALGEEQYRVTADVQTAAGEYYLTFTVEESGGGLAITDHYTTKPQ